MSPLGFPNRNLFPDQSNVFNAPEMMQAPEEPQQPDINQMLIDRILQPDPNIEMMRNTINEMPQRSDYSPSIWRRIGAGLTGIGYGPEAASQFLNDPYNKALSEWKTKLGAEKDLTTADTRSTKEATAAYLSGQRVKTAQDKNANIYEIKTKELQANIEKANNNLKLAYDKLQANQNDHAAMMEFKQAQLDAIQARHALDLAQRERVADETKRKHDAEIEKLKADTEKSRNATAKASTMAARAQRAVIEHPEWADYITKDPNTGQFKVVPQAQPRTFMGVNIGTSSGPDAATHKLIQDYLLEGTQGASSNDLNNTNKQPPQAPKGWKYVPKPGGGWTAVKDDGVK